VRELLLPSPRPPPSAPQLLTNAARPSSARVRATTNTQHTSLSDDRAAPGVPIRPSSARITRSASSLLTAVDSITTRVTSADREEAPSSRSAAFLVSPPPSSLHRHDVNVATQCGVFLTSAGGGAAVQKPQALPFRSSNIGYSGGGAGESSQRRRKSSVMLRGGAASTAAVSGAGLRAAPRKSFAYQLPSGRNVVAGEVDAISTDDEVHPAAPAFSHAITAAASSRTPEKQEHQQIELQDVALVRSVVFHNSSEVGLDSESLSSSKNSRDPLRCDEGDEADNHVHCGGESQRQVEINNAASCNPAVAAKEVVSDGVTRSRNSGWSVSSAVDAKHSSSGKCVTSVVDAYEAAHYSSVKKMRSVYS
jgi:hypothetical protein